MIGVLALALTAPTVAAQWPTSPTFTTRSGQVHNPVPSPDFIEDYWIPNGPLYHMSADGGAVYLSGSFSHVGMPALGFALFDRASGDPQPGWPPFSGEIRDIEPDGAGGWYVAGDFTKVGDVSQGGLVHLLANGTVDTAFQFTTTGRVDELAVDGGLVYVGGNFLTVSGTPRRYLAAVDAVTGAVDPWDPTFGALNWTGSPRLYDIVVDAGKVYVGGDFEGFFLATPRDHFAALDQATGALLPLDPMPDQFVTSLEVHGSQLVLAGAFLQIAGAARTRLAMVDSTTGALDPLDVVLDRLIWDAALVGNTLYFCGAMKLVSGQPRSGAAAVDLSSGALTPWDPNLSFGTSANVDVYALDHDSGTIYLGGAFDHVGGVERLALAAVDSTVGATLPWRADLSQTSGSTEPYDVAVQGPFVAVGGDFSVAGGEPRSGVAAIDAATGLLLPWNPVFVRTGGSFSGSVTLPLPGGILVGSRFDTIHGVAQRNLALVDRATGALVTTFQPPPAVFDSPHVHVLSIAESAGSVFLGGDFPSSSPKHGISLVRLDATTGAEVPGWQAAVGTRPRAIAVDRGSGMVFVGGEFQTAGPTQVTRNHAAAFDLLTGALLPWNPDFEDHVHAFQWRGSRLLVGGEFRTVGGELHWGLVDYLPPYDVPQTISMPRTDVRDFAEHGLLTYVAGPFQMVGLTHREGIFAIDRQSGAIYPWGPDLTGGAECVLVAGGNVIVGGGFSRIGGVTHPFLAAFPIL